ncbi:N-acetyltransferase [Actinocatenispora thailandica]|uniref:N-acetyltransferase n=1 Tax=Actinocatenispora thailandica TaxID=227318 RepID=A0A7R7DTP5_9ACTN|nr:GNAT family N-acetyltransferase [Actinocatenispora thailandica]BCJ37650.1 N-acetyltransferase [Actinocatenispora thailandica]
MLSSTDVGRRVVIRRRVRDASGAPKFADVLGELVAADDAALSVRPDRGGPLVTVPRDEVEAAKPVPPRRRRVSPIHLQHIAAATWQPYRRDTLGDWLLGSSDGWTRRANSVVAAGDPGLPLAEAIDAVVAWYQRHDQPARAQLVAVDPDSPAGADDPELRRVAGLDAALAARGWPVEAETLLLTAPIDRLRRAPRPASLPPVRLSETPTPDWLAMFGARKGLAPAATAVLTAGDTRFAEVHLDGALVAIGRGAIADGHLGLSAIEVAPAFRRRGLARHLLAALADAAFDHAHTAFLQVEEENAAARALYARLTFRLHHRYHYRTAP